MVWDEINIQISRQNKRLAVLLSSTLREFFLPDGLPPGHQLIPDFRSTLKHQLFLGLKFANLQTEKIGSPASPVCSLTLWAFSLASLQFLRIKLHTHPLISVSLENSNTVIKGLWLLLVLPSPAAHSGKASCHVKRTLGKPTEKPT